MDLDITQKTTIAARNNADLYEAVFAAHGLRYRRTAAAFIGLDAPPPYYSNLTTLSDGPVKAQMAEIAALARAFDGRIGLKDSFCRFDLTGRGFTRLFGADWLWREAGAGGIDAAKGWYRIETARDLASWETAWKTCGSPTEARMFPPDMLQMPQIAFFGKRTDDGSVARCIANMSADCVGVSNIFGTDPGTETFAAAANVAAGLAPDKPVVGYQSAENRHRMHDAGFQSVGKLQIWVARSARF